MRNYPQPGDLIRIKDGGEIQKVKSLWKPRRVLLEDGRIFCLGGIEPYDPIAEMIMGVIDMLAGDWEEEEDE